MQGVTRQLQWLCAQAGELAERSVEDHLLLRMLEVALQVETSIAIWMSGGGAENFPRAAVWVVEVVAHRASWENLRACD